MVLFEMKNIKKSFGSLEVLKDISLQVEEGEVLSIIGPSGSGKSTFLRSLNLLEEPTDGEIIFNGVDITKKRYKDASGKVTLGYVDLNGVTAGSTVATLTFAVKDPTALDKINVTVTETERNDQTVNNAETLTADLHTETETVNAKAATCTEDGYTGDEVCTVCQEVVKKGEVIPATGHDYKDGKCANCGETDPNYKPAEPENPGVKTGDEAHTALWLAAASVSLLAAALLLGKKKHLS